MPPTDTGPFAPAPRPDGKPLFAEPWQVELLAVAHTLAAHGLFSPADWSVALGAELRRPHRHEQPDDPSAYYAAALRALERLVVGAGAVTSSEVDTCVAKWHRAYINTPHGQPVRLAAGGD